MLRSYTVRGSLLGPGQVVEALAMTCGPYEVTRSAGIWGIATAVAALHRNYRSGPLPTMTHSQRSYKVLDNGIGV